MDTKNEIIKIWRECFPADSAAWVEMYFANAYRQECAMTLVQDDVTVSSLLLQQYAMTFHDERVNASYISGAATRHRFRNHGYMTQLMKESIAASALRGDMLCTLIPANSRLYFYYAKLGFATVFYNSVLRYTSAHSFPVEKEYSTVSADDIERLYAAFSEIMAQRDCCIQHDIQQFKTIMADNSLCNGTFAAITDNTDRNISAMAWAVPDSSRSIKVIDVLARDEDSYNAVLRELQMQNPDKAMTVMERPLDNSVITLTPHGMARLLRPDQALAIIARNYPQLRLNIRVTDSLLTENNAIYALAEGNINLLPYDSPKVKPDLDITIEVLTAILFSSHKIGQIMGLPAKRPLMSLMLD